MKRIRFLIMLATMLISSGLAYGQIAVDVNKDGKVDLADIVMMINSVLLTK